MLFSLLKAFGKSYSLFANAQESNENPKIGQFDIPSGFL